MQSPSMPPPPVLWGFNALNDEERAIVCAIINGGPKPHAVMRSIARLYGEGLPEGNIGATSAAADAAMWHPPQSLTAGGTHQHPVFSHDATLVTTNAAAQAYRLVSAGLEPGGSSSLVSADPTHSSSHDGRVRNRESHECLLS